MGAGAEVFAGAAAGFAAGGVADVGGFAGDAGEGAAVFSDGVFTSACTEPEAVAFTPPGTAGLSADGFESPSGAGVEGDLVSSGMSGGAKPISQRISGER